MGRSVLRAERRKLEIRLPLVFVFPQGKELECRSVDLQPVPFSVLEENRVRRCADERAQSLSVCLHVLRGHLSPTAPSTAAKSCLTSKGLPRLPRTWSSAHFSSSSTSADMRMT